MTDGVDHHQRALPTMRLIFPTNPTAFVTPMRKIALQSRVDFFLRIRSLGRFLSHSTTPRTFRSANARATALAKVLGRKHYKLELGFGKRISEPTGREATRGRNELSACNCAGRRGGHGVGSSAPRLPRPQRRIRATIRQPGSFDQRAARTPHIASRQRGSGPLAGLGGSRLEVQREAEPLYALSQNADDPAELWERALLFDASLKQRRLNPGASADLTVATLFVRRLRDLGLPDFSPDVCR